MQQLQLDIAIRPDARLTDFSGSSWTPILDAVRQLQVGLLPHLFLYGVADSGKSHLLAAICESYYDTQRSAIQVSMRQLIHSPIEILASLESFDVLLIDDVEAIADLPDWQEAMFHLINRNQHAGKQWVIASHIAPAQLQLQLPDLHTRFMQAISFALPQGVLYAERKAMLNAVIARRGWRFDAAIIEHLLQFGPHQAGAVLRLLLRLEPHFINRKRALSKLEVKNILLEIESWHRF